MFRTRTLHLCLSLTIGSWKTAWLEPRDPGGGHPLPHVTGRETDPQQLDDLSRPHSWPLSQPALVDLPGGSSDRVPGHEGLATSACPGQCQQRPRMLQDSLGWSSCPWASPLAPPALLPHHLPLHPKGPAPLLCLPKERSYIALKSGTSFSTPVH